MSSWSGFHSRVGPLNVLLSPLSLLYSIGWRSYAAMYGLGIKRAAEPYVPVVCVGNLRVGGTGKTPFVVFLARLMTELGHSVVLGASGYGSPAAEAAQLAPSGPLMASEWGDEPALLRWLLPDLPIIVGRRRVLAAEICAREFPMAVLLMDDGFQHLPLKKHLTIVLDPPGGNSLCLPAGPYREPKSMGARADLVLPGAFRLVRSETQFLDRGGGRHYGPKRGNVQVVCGIGEPIRFLRGLEAAGYHVFRSIVRADHDPLTEGNLFDGLDPGIPVVVTAKDWMKLRSRDDIDQFNIHIANYEVHVEPETEFRHWLIQRLDEIKAKRA